MHAADRTFHLITLDQRSLAERDLQLIHNGFSCLSHLDKIASEIGSKPGNNDEKLNGTLELLLTLFNFLRVHMSFPLLEGVIARL